MLSLRTIEVLYALTKTGSASATARQLHIAQPTVSKILQTAEQELGICLFNRIRGKLVPTNSANHLAPQLEKLIKSAHFFEQQAGVLQKRLKTEDKQNSGYNNTATL